MGSNILLFIFHPIKTKCYANATVLFPGCVISAGGYLWDMISKYLGYSIFLNILSFPSVTQTGFSLSQAMAAAQDALNSKHWERPSSSVLNRHLLFFAPLNQMFILMNYKSQNFLGQHSVLSGPKDLVPHEKIMQKSWKNLLITLKEHEACIHNPLYIDHTLYW